MPTPEQLQAALDTLTREVGETGTAEDSAIALLVGLRQQLADALAAGTPQAVVDQITALAAELDARQATLAAAVAAPPAPESPAP